MTDPLDALLAAPLPEIRDDGFSSRVMAQIYKARQRDTLLTYVVVAIAALPLFFLLPVPKLSATLSDLLPAIASSGPLAAAVALIVLTLSLENLIRQR